jgi:hypothetical protein
MIPMPIVRMLRVPPLEPREFTATKFHSMEDKAWFGNALLKFIAADFPEASFTNRLYNVLSNTFGHIAHYDRSGFYDHFFRDLDGKIAFLDQTLRWPCYGSPEYTFSDVEIIVQSRLALTHLLELTRSCRQADIATRERQLLSRLKAKYEPHPEPSAPPTTTLHQPSLFDLSV